MIQKQNILEALGAANQNWHSSDFFVSPDEKIPQSIENLALNPNFYSLNICIEGEIELSINTHKIKVTPFNLFATNPESGTIKINTINNCVIRTIFFTMEFLLKNEVYGKIVDDFTFYRNSSFVYLKLSSQEAFPFIQLYEILSSKEDSFNSNYGKEIVRTLLLTFLYETQNVYGKQNQLTKQKPTKKDDISYQFKELVNRQGSINTNLKYYADLLFVTPKYLIEAIKEKNGKTPKAMLIEARIKDAKCYLQNSDLTISEISDQLYFSDVAAFSKFFKKSTGNSPSHYRKNFV